MADTACFELVYPGGERVDTGDCIPHFPTRETALAQADHYRCQTLGLPAPRQLSQPCVSLFLVCAGCGAEEDDVTHFEDREQALQYAKDGGWQVDGDEALCNDCKAQTAVTS